MAGHTRVFGVGGRAAATLGRFEWLPCPHEPPRGTLFRVWRSGVRVRELGFRDSDQGLKAQGLGFTGWG